MQPQVDDQEERLNKVVTLVKYERLRQIEQEGFDAAHDDAHEWGELALAGACYAMNAASPVPDGRVPLWWPFEESWWKPVDQLLDLRKAAALLLAEIERIDRLNQHRH